MSEASIGWPGVWWGALTRKGLEGVLALPKAAGTAEPKFIKRKLYKYMCVFMHIEKRLK